MSHRQTIRLRKALGKTTPAEWRAAKRRYKRLPAPQKGAFWALLEG